MFNETIINTIIVALERQERVLAEAPNAKGHGLVTTVAALNLMRSLATGDMIALLWGTQDVKALALDDQGDPIPGVSISDAEARDVLALALSNHDNERGVNWDVLDEHLNYVKEERSHVEA